jgi:hypothetical protein
MKQENPRYVLEGGENARQTPVRLLVVQGEKRPPVDASDEPEVMSMPHLFLREGIALVSISLVLVLLAILVDAPLEEIANPQKTPNPAKAPWYFLGLQELLHYYPPIVAGVLLPGLVVMSLIVIPYFNVNLKREAFWRTAVHRKMIWLWGMVALLSLIFLFASAHPVWPILIPLWLVAVFMTLPAVAHREGGWVHWLGDRSLAFWIFLWFLLSSTTLTVMGTLFRGPGWQFTLPWRDGIF